MFLKYDSQAEILDRVVAIVDGHIITWSDIRQERRVRALLGEKSVEDDKVLARDLVDAYLIEREIVDSADAAASDAEVEAELNRFSAPGAPIDEAVRNAVRRRLRIQKFLDLKFGESIKPTDEEIQKYYSEVFLPAARTRGLNPIPPLTDGEMAKAVRENVIRESMDHEVMVWLEVVRRRSNIDTFQ